MHACMHAALSSTTTTVTMSWSCIANVYRYSALHFLTCFPCSKTILDMLLFCVYRYSMLMCVCLRVGQCVCGLWFVVCDFVCGCVLLPVGVLRRRALLPLRRWQLGCDCVQASALHVRVWTPVVAKCDYNGTGAPMLRLCTTCFLCVDLLCFPVWLLFVCCCCNAFFFFFFFFFFFLFFLFLCIVV